MSIEQQNQTQLYEIMLQLTQSLNSEQCGTIKYNIIQKLNQNINNPELDDFIPQLCFLFYVNPNQNIEEILKRYGMKNIQNFYRLEWTLKAYNDNGKSYVKQKYLDLYKGLKQDFVNKGLQSFNSISQQQFDDIFLIKDARATYQDRQEQMLFNLIEQSLLLKQIDVSKRKQNMTNFLKNININIKYMQRYLPPCYSGITIPFNFGLRESCLVVNIIENEFICFNTAKRVPYKIIVETVCPQEILRFYTGDQQQDYLNNGQFNLRPVQDIEGEMSKISKLKIFQGINITELKNLATDQFSKLKKIKAEKEKAIQQDVYSSENFSTSEYWGESWEKFQQKIRSKSIFGNFKTYELRQIIIKGGDDLRSELLIMQMIRKINQIFINQGLNIYLRPYDIILTSPNSGILEFIPNTVSLDKIKKDSQGFSLKDFYQQNFKDFELAQKNFACSLAGYSIISYLFQLKDRHNGNILIDNKGHIIHIDFGFVLTLSPGNLSFESAPFKLIEEYVNLLNGINSDLYFYYKTLVFSGFLAIQESRDEILSYLKIMSSFPQQNLLLCLNNFDFNEQLKRFNSNLQHTKLHQKVEELITESLNSWSTQLYDYYQYKTNQIYY